jgi:hypothetical protein
MSAVFPTFLRVFDMKKDKEILINVNAISEIDVEYVVPGKMGDKNVGFAVGLERGRTDPEAIRIYTIVAGGVTHKLPANPGSPVMEVLETIYKNAIKNE